MTDSGVLRIDGTDYDQSSRAAGNLIVDGFGWDLDSDSWLEFHEHHGGPQPRFKGALAVEYRDYSGVLRFVGTVTSVQASADADGRSHGYRCQGYRYRLNQYAVASRDGSGSAVYDLPPDDRGFVAALSGKSIGWILADCLNVNAPALAACGVATDSTTLDQLAALSYTPPDPVRFGGERLADALASLLQSHLPSKRLHYTPAGLVRIADVSEGAALTVTQELDPIEPPVWSRSWSDAATRVVVRGAADADGAYVESQATPDPADTLKPAWNAADEAAWTWADFEAPADAMDAGAVVSIDGPDQVTVSSPAAWPVANQWAARSARIQLFKTTALGVAYTETSTVSASAVKAAGGSAALQLGLPLQNSASGAYDSWRMVGTAAPAGSLSNVHRLFAIDDPGGWVKDHLLAAFPVEFPFLWAPGAAMLVSFPSAMLFGPTSGIQAGFSILPDQGKILFDRPVVEKFNEPADLAVGGSAVVKPSVLALLAYSRGALQAVHPPDVGGSPVFAGGAFDWAGLQRTRVVDLPSWTYRGNSALALGAAQVIHESISDVTVEGTVRRYGPWPEVWSRGDGVRLSVASALATIGDEALAAPVRSASVRIVSSGGGLLYATEARCSTRRDMRCSTAGYEHLSTLGSGPAIGSEAGAGWSPVATPPTAPPGEESPEPVAVPEGEGFEWGSAPGGNTSGRYKKKRVRQSKPYSHKRAKVGHARPKSRGVEKRRKAERAAAKARSARAADARKAKARARPDVQSIRADEAARTGRYLSPEDHAAKKAADLESARRTYGERGAARTIGGFLSKIKKAIVGPLQRDRSRREGLTGARAAMEARKDREGADRRAAAGRNAERENDRDRRKIESEDAP